LSVQASRSVFNVLDDIGVLTDISPRRKALFRKLMGDRLIDILWHLPYNINDRQKKNFLKECTPGTYVTIMVEVAFHVPSHALKKPAKVVCTDAHDKLELLYFNTSKHYLTKVAPSGLRIVVSGKIEYDANQRIWQMIHPDHVGGPETLNHWIGTEAVYHLTAGLTQSMVRSIIHKCLSLLPRLAEWHSPETLQKYKFPSFNQSLSLLHNPISKKELSFFHPAKMRLVFDEFLAQQLSLQMTRRHHVQVRGAMLKHKHRLINGLLKSLPFELTKAQQEAYLEVERDLLSSTPMLRLLQGDVGSGKTIVAIMAMLQAVEAGYQAAILAPTEILARQHYTSLQKFVGHLGVHVEILTSREKGKARQSILEGLDSDRINILVGTHAIIRENVKFKRLAFVVIDEQHRFGVEQRLALSQKGRNTHILTMTATPIPRTLMMANYGEMDVSFIREKPPDRQEINTKLICINRFEEVVQGIQRFLDKGQKIYWVCPLIEESETLDLAAVTDRYEYLINRFPKRVGMIHGRIKSLEKEVIMDQFARGHIDILVTTTVIEVGVDVPLATLMIIEHAERFGLTQLHQLRGRVGRGSDASVCVLMYAESIGAVAQRRLEIMRESNDGFLIAEEDLKLRGGGELLGTRQAGLPKYHFADFAIDDPRAKRLQQELLSDANQIAKEALDDDVSLKKYTAYLLLLDLFNKSDVAKYKRSA
jgi:ATP-dependent DNA helicase RecG